MFTGLIEEVGEIVASERAGGAAGGLRLHIGAKLVLEGLQVGDSISTNGVCLTVVGFNPRGFWADVMPQTAGHTNLGLSGAVVGTRVNLERALRLGDRLGGHLVSGHVDEVGEILEISEDANARWFTIGASAGVMQFVIDRGSIAVDGISLTVAQVSPVALVHGQRPFFKVSIIPHTLGETNLAYKRRGDFVNLECDMFAKYAARFMGMQGERRPITIDFLSENGFLD